MNTKKVFTWAAIISIGGFLFGLDTAVISGAEQKIQELWDLDVFEHGLTVSIALVGTVFGAMLGGIPSDRLGRKKTIFWVAVLFLLSAIGTALAFNWYSFLIFRFVGGLGVGCSSVTAPMYISELSPATHRGRFVAMFQFNVVFGILVAFLSNYLLKDIGDNAWRWMLGVQAFPATLFMALILLVPESPRWLIVKQKAFDEAKEILREVNPLTAEQEFHSIKLSTQSNGSVTAEGLFSAKYSFPITLAVLFAFFNQASGVNAIIYYAPRIFEMAGIGKDSSLLSTAGVGVVNFIFNLLAMYYIDSFGRKKLMIVGSLGGIATLALVSYSFFAQDFSGYAVPIYIFLFIGFFSFSQGAVIWVFISEIFPNAVRSQGQALGSFTHWFMASVIAFVFPYLSEKIGGGPSFLIFTIMMTLQLVFVLTIMPETKGKSLEELGENLQRRKAQEEKFAIKSDVTT
jgi:MFS transporter, SP family, arabinose:H+ symporter